MTGFRHGARVVTAAAIIMISVFAGSRSPARSSSCRWPGPGGRDRVDAFVVRMTLVPAALALLGRAAWWLPGWLGRILPRVDVEGVRLRTLVEQQATADRTPVGAGQSTVGSASR